MPVFYEVRFFLFHFIQHFHQPILGYRLAFEIRVSQCQAIVQEQTSQGIVPHRFVLPFGFNFFLFYFHCGELTRRGRQGKWKARRREGDYSIGRFTTVAEVHDGDVWIKNQNAKNIEDHLGG